MNKDISRQFTLDELKFIQLMNWNLYSVSSFSRDDIEFVNIRVLLSTFHPLYYHKLKVKTRRSYVCKEYDQFLQNRLMRLVIK